MLPVYEYSWSIKCPLQFLSLVQTTHFLETFVSRIVFRIFYQDFLTLCPPGYLLSCFSSFTQLILTLQFLPDSSFLLLQINLVTI